MVGIAIIKIGFTMDNYNYESNLKKMDKEVTIDNQSKIEHKTLELSGFDIHYYVSGKQNKEVIVFLHPAFSDHRAFDQQIDYFSKDYKVITIDLIGHGMSKAKKSKDKIDASPEHIKKILELEKINRTHIVSVSIGSLIAQYFSLKYPDNIQSLTALGAYDINKVNPEIQKGQRGTNLSLMVRAIFSMKSFRKKGAQLTCSTEKGQALFYKTTSHYGRKSFPVMQGLQNIIKDRKNIVINYPTLVMTGELELEFAKKMSISWHADLKNSEYYMVKKAGHCANIDAPEEFNKRVKEFIDKNKE